MINGLREVEFAAKLKEYLTPAQAISRQERLYGRDAKLRTILRGFASPGKHAFIFGDRGVGKTSLAKTAAFLAQPSAQDLALVACDNGATFFTLVQDMARQLLTDSKMVERVTKEESGKLNLAFAHGEVRTKIERGVIPSLSTINDAARLLREAASAFQDPPVVIVDEFDQLASSADKKLFADLIKQLSDQEIPLKLIFCGIGKSLEELIGVHLSTDRYIVPVELEPISHDARWAIIQTAADAFSVSIDRETVIRIGRISDGFPYYVHLAGEQIFWAMFDDPNQVSACSLEHFHAGLSGAIEEAHTSLKHAYELAVQKYKNSPEYEIALWAVADGTEFRRVAGQIYDKSYLPIMTSLKQSPLIKEHFYQRLNSLKKTSHGAILESPIRGWYQFKENMVRGFVRLQAERAGLNLGIDHYLA